MGTRFWFVAACCSALLACGGQSSKTDVGSGAVAGKAGTDGEAGYLGGENSNGGSLGEGGGLVAVHGGTAGSVASAGGDALGGSAGDAGAFGGTVDLCLYPNEIPDEWSNAGAGGEASVCAVGQPGQFVFDGCRYELLEATAHDVDPFQGGHSHCCYQSKLLDCP